jgi:hypothetical protein
MGLRFEAKRIFFSFLFLRSYLNISMNLRCRLLWIQKYFFEDSKTNGNILLILGPALHDMNDFQVTVSLTWLAVIHSLTFESAQ